MIRFTCFNQIQNIKMQFVIFQFFGITKISDGMVIYTNIMLEKKPDKYHRTYAHISTNKFLCTLQKIEEYDTNETCWHNTCKSLWTPITHWFRLFDIPRGIRISICVSWTISWDRISFNILGRSSSMYRLNSTSKIQKR